MAAFVVAGELCSGRTACRCLRLARSSFHYRMRPPTSERTRLVTRLHELSRKYPRYGFRRIAVKLRGEGYQVGRKQVQKLRRAEGSRVPPPRRYTPRRGASTARTTPIVVDYKRPPLQQQIHWGYIHPRISQKSRGAEDHAQDTRFLSFRTLDTRLS